MILHFKSNVHSEFLRFEEILMTDQVMVRDSKRLFLNILLSYVIEGKHLGKAIQEAALYDSVKLRDSTVSTLCVLINEIWTNMAREVGESKVTAISWFTEHDHLDFLSVTIDGPMFLAFSESTLATRDFLLSQNRISLDKFNALAVNLFNTMFSPTRELELLDPTKWYGVDEEAVRMLGGWLEHDARQMFGDRAHLACGLYLRKNHRSTLLKHEGIMVDIPGVPTHQ